MRNEYKIVAGAFGFLFILAQVSQWGVVTAANQQGTVKNLENYNFVDRRDVVLSDLYLAIEDAQNEGKYECCIEPECTMCYLGEFIWDSGECHCDELIARGEQPCAQCEHKLGYTEGSVCASSTTGADEKQDETENSSYLLETPKNN